VKIPVTTFEIKAACCEIDDRASFLQKIQRVMTDFETHIICFDAEKMSGINHVRSAVVLAVRSFDQGNSISNSVEMEALLYASGSRQTSIGASFGIHKGKNRLYISCFPVPDGIWEALCPLVHFCECENSWEHIDQQKRKNLMDLFVITEEELATTVNQDLKELILERVALLNVSR
jgi:KEOPS complex subunit Cgi121